MAAVHQQSPIAFRAKLSSASRFAFKSTNLSFSSTFSGVKLAVKLAAMRKPAGGARMMDTAAGRYAAALADVAKSHGTLELTSADMEKVDQVFSDPQVFNFFLNPTIDTEKKRKVLDDIAVESKLQPYTANFLNIVVDMKRVEIIKDIVKEFEVVYNKLTNTELAVVSSVVMLGSQHLAQIAKGVQRLTRAKNVRIKTVIDPSLVAGFTIRYGSSGSKLIDMSVKKQLDELASQLNFSDMDGSLAL
ncbi:ATP synthase delta chain, chloroplastic-like [Aristolochia californica]|uniref:ATP synthase delta chain, chloroplastic-like n=1 Tax=Aristolochia californica TaxID=171875 RepID=UPI0035D59046